MYDDYNGPYTQLDIDEPDFDTDHDCEHCGQNSLCDFVVDPFLDGVFPEDGPHPKSWWCEKCYYDRKEEV